MVALEPLTPDAEQLGAIWRMAYEPTNAALNTSGLGRGKTCMALEVAKARHADTLLVIAPLGTRLGWKVTAERQGMDHPFHWIKNDTKKDGVLKALLAGEKGIYFIGTEYFRTLGWKKTALVDGNGNQRRDDKGKLMWKTDRTPLWNRVYPDFIVFDESHKASNKKTNTYKTMQLATGENYLRGKYKMAMSATPSGNKFSGAWSIPRWLWPDDEIVPRSYNLWVGKWAKTEFDPFSFTKKKVIGEKNPGAWYASLPCHIHLEAKPHEVIREERFIELTPRQRKIYDDIEKNNLAWLGEHPLATDLPISQQMRQHQITLAEPVLVPREVTDILTGKTETVYDVTFNQDAKSAKMEEILNIIRDDIDEETALIYSMSQKFNANVVVPRLRKAGYAAEAYDGTLSDAKKEAAKARFLSGETRYLVVVIAAGGTGIDGFQKATRNVIWANKDLSGVNNEQAAGRVPRQGQEHTVREFLLTGLNTRDQKTYTSLVTDEVARRQSLKGVAA